MTSTLFSASIAAPTAGPSRGAPTGRRGRALGLLAFLHVLLDHVTVLPEPVGRLHELAALHLPDLDPAAALVVGGRQREVGRRKAGEGEALDPLEAVLHVLARDLAALLGPERVANGLEVDGRHERAAVVIDGGRHLLGGLLSLLLVHGANLVQDGVVGPDARELEPRVPLRHRDPARGPFVAAV